MKGHQFLVRKTDLAQLQCQCTCNSGAQQDNPCAQASSCIYFITRTLNGLLDKKLKTSKRDAKITQSITNLRPDVKHVYEITKSDVELQLCLQSTMKGSHVTM